MRELPTKSGAKRRKVKYPGGRIGYPARLKGRKAGKAKARPKARATPKTTKGRMVRTKSGKMRYQKW